MFLLRLRSASPLPDYLPSRLGSVSAAVSNKSLMKGSFLRPLVWMSLKRTRLKSNGLPAFLVWHINTVTGICRFSVLLRSVVVRLFWGPKNVPWGAYFHMFHLTWKILTFNCSIEHSAFRLSKLSLFELSLVVISLSGVGCLKTRACFTMYTVRQTHVTLNMSALKETMWHVYLFLTCCLSVPLLC